MPSSTVDEIRRALIALLHIKRSLEHTGELPPIVVPKVVTLALTQDREVYRRYHELLKLINEITFSKYRNKVEKIIYEIEKAVRRSKSKEELILRLESLNKKYRELLEYSW